MDKHFIKNIDIATYKCFKDFSASGFERVNLISGKNNVGKTAFLEACYLSAHSESIKDFSSALTLINLRRHYPHTNRSNYGKYFDETQEVIIATNSSKIAFNNIVEDIESYYDFQVGNRSNKISKADFLKNFQRKKLNSHIRIITPLRAGSSSNLIKLYESIQEEDREEEVDEYINQFDSNLKGLKFISQKPKIKKDNSYHELDSFGDGLKAYVALILAIYSCKDGLLFIDEIENGIHYTLLDKIWEIILTTSQNVNCQVFATTHSKECIEAYGREASRLKDKNISFTTLVQDNNNGIQAITHGYDLFMNNLKQDHEVRGW